MEYVDGRTLRDILQTEGRLLPQRALEIAPTSAPRSSSRTPRASCTATSSRPTSCSPAGEVKVMDFGIARAARRQLVHDDPDRGGHRHRRVPLARAGPRRARRRPLRPLLDRLPALRAAHRARRRSSATPRSPWPTSTSARTRRRRRSTTRRCLGAVDAVVLKAMAKNPANRYQSADEMREDLLRAVAGQPVLATRVLATDAAELEAREARRRGESRGFVYAVVRLLLVAVDRVGAARPRAARQRQQPHQTADRRRPVSAGCSHAAQRRWAAGGQGHRAVRHQASRHGDRAEPGRQLLRPQGRIGRPHGLARASR